MIYIPFVYFSIIFFLVFRRRCKIDIASYVILLYAVISFFGILVDHFDLRYNDELGYNISLEASVVYCLLLTVFWLPIYSFTSKNVIVLFPVVNDKLLRCVSVVSFVFFIITLIGSFKSLVGVLSGDMLALRLAMYAGDAEQSWFASLPLPLRIPVIAGNMFFGSFWIMQFLSFFSFFIQKIEKKYSFFLILSSLIGPLWGILAIDRSKVTYWILALFANFILFSDYMNAKQKRMLKIFCFVLTVMLVIYLSMMTNARFESRYYSGLSGSMGGILTYLGQPFINFAFFYDNFTNLHPTLAMIFPFIHKYVFGSFGSGVEVQEFLTETYKMQFGVFYTFLGQILISGGKLVMFLYVAIMSVFGCILFRSGKIQFYSLLKLYLFMVYSSIMFLGLFGHYYANSICTFSAVAFVFVFKLLMTRNR